MLLRQYGLIDGATGSGGHLPKKPSTRQQSGASDGDGSGASIGAGCTLAGYAEAKRLPVEFLRSLGLSDVRRARGPAVRVPYLDVEGREAAVRYRLALTREPGGGDRRFCWARGAKPCLYGLDRLGAARATGWVVVVEGESCCHTLWYAGIPALGVPGASSWDESRDAPHLDGFAAIYLGVEPDAGGETALQGFGKSRIRDRLQLVFLRDAKDVSELYLADPDRFAERLNEALTSAVPWAEHAEADRLTRRSRALAGCEELAGCARILDRLADELRRAGLVGELRAAQLVYLAATSRLLDRPVSVAVKGPSSAGKSYTVAQTLAFLPPEAYHELTAMSERALVYSQEPLEHRMLVVYEAAGLQSEFASYLLRSLLSEGRLRYETVESTPEGLRPRLVEREGPTGLIVTTTAVGLHPENETRLLSIPVKDSNEQTRAILDALAHDTRREIDHQPWHELQRWIAADIVPVVIPYAPQLMGAIPGVAVRLRRDGKVLLNLIKAHALLHQASRARDTDGRILATLEDYAVVRELVYDLIAEGIEATVSDPIRETVAAVPAPADCIPDSEGVTLRQVAATLGIDKSAVSRRVRSAIDRGYLVNLADGNEVNHCGSCVATRSPTTWKSSPKLTPSQPPPVRASEQSGRVLTCCRRNREDPSGWIRLPASPPCVQQRRNTGRPAASSSTGDTTGSTTQAYAPAASATQKQPRSASRTGYGRKPPHPASPRRPETGMARHPPRAPSRSHLDNTVDIALQHDTAACRLAILVHARHIDNMSFERAEAMAALTKNCLADPLKLRNSLSPLSEDKLSAFDPDRIAVSLADEIRRIRPVSDISPRLAPSRFAHVESESVEVALLVGALVV